MGILFLSICVGLIFYVGFRRNFIDLAILMAAVMFLGLLFGSMMFLKQEPGYWTAAEKQYIVENYNVNEKYYSFSIADRKEDMQVNCEYVTHYHKLDEKSKLIVIKYNQNFPKIFDFLLYGIKDKFQKQTEYVFVENR